MSEKKTGVECIVCKRGIIVERTHIPYIAAISPDIYGPGGKNVATEKDRARDGFHCPECGIEYHKLPN